MQLVTRQQWKYQIWSEKLLNTKKVGHTGTLDPEVTGTLPIAIGSATRFIQYLPQGKSYIGKIKLGIRTKTDDIHGDIINQKGLREEFIKKTDVKNVSEEQLTRKNPINKKLFNILEDYGYKPNLDKFNNQFELIQEVAGVIDGLYKDRLIRTVVPVTKKGGFKDSVIFGIENPKDVTINNKLM